MSGQIIIALDKSPAMKQAIDNVLQYLSEEAEYFAAIEMNELSSALKQIQKQFEEAMHRAIL